MLQKIKITPTQITPRQVNTARGPATVFDIQTAGGQKYSCWSEKLINSFEINKEVEVSYTVIQKGGYTNYTIVSPDSNVARDEKVADALKMLYDQMQVNHQEILDAIKGRTKPQTTEQTSPPSDTTDHSSEDSEVDEADMRF